MTINRNWKINEYIRAPQLRVIGADGKQIGVLSREEALAKAREENLDLIEIAPQAKPPVAKVVELGKFLYQEEKRARAEKKKMKASELKEIRFSPFIAENDFDTRLVRVREFLGDKNKVKIVVKFTGRQMDVKDSGYGVVDRIFKQLGDGIAIDMKPKFLGRHLVTVISPVLKSKKIEKENKVDKDAKTEN